MRTRRLEALTGGTSSDTALARRYDVPYVRTADLDLPYLPDGLHLTDTGHVTFGDFVPARIATVS